jgi:hypothetical protein
MEYCVKKINHLNKEWRIDFEVDGITGDVTKVWLDDGDGNYLEHHELPQDVRAKVINTMVFYENLSYKQLENTILTASKT